jgi:UDP-glucuronate 4-epimerase
MAHALVTGGAGFIGSHLVDRLLSEGWRVTVVDDFDPFYPAAVKHRNIAAHRRHAAWSLLEVDISDMDALLAQVTGTFDVIVHLAAKAGVRPSLQHPRAFQRANVTGTLNMLELASTLGISRFVFASSSSVYGVNPRVPWREDDQVLLPISPYASTKVSGELLGHVYSHLYGIRFIALRLFTVYGPRQRPDLAIHKFARLMLDGHPIPVFGDGSTRRDYTHVTDVVAGICSAIGYEGSRYEVINLGNNHTVSLAELIAALERALGITAVIERHPDQPGDVPQTWASIEKARALLRYDPATPFEAGIGGFARWVTNEEEVGVR